MKILVLSGSTRKKSVNTDLLKILQSKGKGRADLHIYSQLDQLPHFNQDLDGDDVPAIVQDFRKQIEEADGLIISTPEYVFSLPAIVKNAIEWLVATTVLSDKPTAAITASTVGKKGHESLVLILNTLYCKISEETCLLISEAKSKINAEGIITDTNTAEQLNQLWNHFTASINESLAKK